MRLFVKLMVGLVACLVGTASGRFAQAQEADTLAAEPAWNVDVIGKLSGSQAGYRNWQEGGINTLAVTTGLDAKARRTVGNWAQTHEARLAFGLVKQEQSEVRKADDLIRLSAALQYAGAGFFRTFNPTIAIAARSQFAAGFNYDKNPFTGDTRPPPVKVSDFFSPATFTQTVGLAYDPAPWFKQRFGLAAKETVVRIERLRPLYGVPSDRSVRMEVGMESKTEFDREVVENVRLKSSLGLFAAFNKPDLPDLIWENLVAMKVNAWLGVNLEFAALYDRDVSRALQMKEVLSVGVSFVFI